MSDSDSNETACDHCGKVYNRYLGDRFWSGRYRLELPNGDIAVYETLCNGCYSALVK